MKTVRNNNDANVIDYYYHPGYYHYEVFLGYQSPLESSSNLIPIKFHGVASDFT